MFPPLSPRRPELPNAAGEYAPIVSPPEQSPDSPRMPPPIDYAVLDSFMKPDAAPAAQPTPTPAPAVPATDPSPASAPIVPQQPPPAAPSEAEQDKAFDQTIGDLAAPALHTTTPQVGAQQHDEERAPEAQAKVDDRLPEKTGKEWRILDAIFSGLARKPYDSDFWSQQDAKVDMARAKDPNSPESIKARQTNAPLLKQFGFTDGEIGNLSASQLANASKGDMVGNLARLKIESAKAKAENERRQAEYERAQRDKLAQEDRANQHKLEDEQRAEESHTRQEVRTGDTAEAKQQRMETEASILAGRSDVANQRAVDRETRVADRRREEEDQREAARLAAEQRAEARRVAAEDRKRDREQGLAPDQQKSIDDWEHAHPGFVISTPGVYAEKYGKGAGRGITKQRADEQDAQMLLNITHELGALRKRYADTDVLSHPVTASAIANSYSAAVDKANGAMSRLSSENTEGAKLVSKAHFPSIMNPFAEDYLKELTPVFNQAADARLASYGASVDPNWSPEDAPGANSRTSGDLGTTKGAPPIPADARKPPTAEHQQKIDVAAGRAGASATPTAPASAPGEAPAAIGTRNGKPVLRIEGATDKAGKRVRVIFYGDGSHEVVNG